MIVVLVGFPLDVSDHQRERECQPSPTPCDTRQADRGQIPQLTYGCVQLVDKGGIVLNLLLFLVVFCFRDCGGVWDGGNT